MEIIYEKRYEHLPMGEMVKTIEQVIDDESEQSAPSFDDIMTKIMANTRYIPISDRIEASSKFIARAIEVSDLYELDTIIERHDDRITVNYSFDCGSGMSCVRDVFGMADEFFFFKDIHGFDITISMDYYTHVVLRNGRIVAPDIDLLGPEFNALFP